MGLLKRLALAVMNKPAEETTALAIRQAAPLALPLPYERREQIQQPRQLQRYAQPSQMEQYEPQDFYEIMQPPPPARRRRKTYIVTETITRREG